MQSLALVSYSNAKLSCQFKMLAYIKGRLSLAVTYPSSVDFVVCIALCISSLCVRIAKEFLSLSSIIQYSTVKLICSRIRSLLQASLKTTSTCGLFS